MPTFEYKGITGEQNKYTDGIIDAINEDEAAYKLRNQKIIITSLVKTKGQVKEKKDSKSIFSFIENFGRIKQKEVVLFSKKISTMIRAGLPVLDSLKMAKDQVKEKKLKKIINEILNDLQGGTDLSGCFEKHPKVFDNIYINMIKAGQASGKLDIFLDKLVSILEKREKIKSQIKSAMFYPIILISVALLITVFMLMKVVPTFTNMYNSMNVELPKPTQMIIAASNFVGSISGLITLIIFISAFILHGFLMKSVLGYKKTFDRIILKFPLFGNIIIQSTIARIALIKANLFAAGVDVLEILDIAMSTTTNTVFISSLEKVKRGVFSGEDMSKLISKEPVFPITYSQLVAVGEKTGNLEEMFTAISNYYEEEFDNIVKNLSTMLEPIAIVIIGALIGVLLVALYMPIFKAGSVIG
jgi:type IV pilus assembly protein PilC|tara:strand:- start:285 stop:1526 length:1242 start_codon:yes stop_codon:yes gene_type:complete